MELTATRDCGGWKKTWVQKWKNF